MFLDKKRFTSFIRNDLEGGKIKIKSLARANGVEDKIEFI